MTIKRKACIAGIYEHPTRKAPDKTVAQLHAECARGALADAGLSLQDVDGYFCAGDAPGMGGNNMADYLGLQLRHVDSTDTGGSSYLLHVSHAAQAIAAGKCKVALVTLAGRPRSEGSSGLVPRNVNPLTPDTPWELPYGAVTVNMYALAAARHMHEFGTTAEQLAWIKVAASHHAQHNPHAMLREVVTVQDVLASPMISDPLRKLDCCVVSDGAARWSSPIPILPRASSNRWSICWAPVKPSRARTVGAWTSPILVRRSPALLRLKKPASNRPTSNTPPSTTASPSPC
ncbi:MAG: hypothetical protein RL509_1914 [Pseudomonadota bacterium]